MGDEGKYNENQIFQKSLNFLSFITSEITTYNNKLR